MKNIDFSKLGMLAPVLLAGGLTTLVLSGCSKAHSNNAAAPVQGAPVTAAVVVERGVTLTQEFSGRLESIERVDIRARVAGYINSVNFTPGSKVRKGQLLFVIDPRPFAAEASRAQASALAASAKAELAKLELKRAEKLLADRAIAQREYDERASALKELNANARAAAAQYETAKLNLNYTQVTAPIDGRVSKAEITVGNLVDQTAVLTSVVSDDRIYASFDGDEETYLQVGARARRNEPVKVRIGLASEAGFPHEGRLEFVDNRLDAGSGAVRMRAIFANTDNLLAPGLFARVQVDSGATDGHKAVLINDQAVSTDQSRKFVYVVGKDNKAEYRQVTLGAATSSLRIVRSGLKAGERIVINGLQRVHPGALLAPQVVAMDGADAKLAAADKGN
ncbi:efflux RND transporter periplasmic adaptor subunit [Duganella dendranthematis]|uniref:Efflux RND transporter periplasmic adaptor subunit n=1 Tax=Duganella dendranthematis TaxID=2728021 RepID=A0ABX6M9G9_9BURK|nr:efflux RND transporter periplasmic adaptor subunit [Duganella dendranthematis]QJD90582.1 efflux RND transporter periplasmic adaptor subunit [Duganella dendranthematis]